MDMLRALGAMNLPWPAVHVLQVDERVAPDGDPDRNLTHLRESLLDRSQTQGVHIHEMPVTLADLTLAALQYDATLQQLAGSPPVLDLVHLGLGPDGHTASLIPGDPVLSVTDGDVAVTGIYQGRQRMTLTYPIINRARRILWVVTGADKTAMLRRLFDGDESIPAGRVSRRQRSSSPTRRQQERAERVPGGESHHPGDGHREDDVLVRLRSHGDGSFVRANHLLGDVEAEAQALAAAGRAARRRGTDRRGAAATPGSIVPALATEKLDDVRRRCRRCGSRTAPVGVAVLQRVADQVRRDLREPLGIPFARQVACPAARRCGRSG